MNINNKLKKIKLLINDLKKETEELEQYINEVKSSNKEAVFFKDIPENIYDGLNSLCEGFKNK